MERLVPDLHRLSVPGLQYEHGLLAHGCSCTISLGEIAHDGPGEHFFNGRSDSGGACGEYSVTNSTQSPLNSDRESVSLAGIVPQDWRSILIIHAHLPSARHRPQALRDATAEELAGHADQPNQPVAAG